MAGAHALQHPVNVILDGLLGQIEVRGDFLVGHALCDQGQELLFAPGQSQVHAHTNRRKLPRVARKVAKQGHAQPRRADRFTLADGAYGRDDVHGRGILQDIAGNARANGLEKSALLRRHADQNDAKAGQAAQQITHHR